MIRIADSARGPVTAGLLVATVFVALCSLALGPLQIPLNRTFDIVLGLIGIGQSLSLIHI